MARPRLVVVGGGASGLAAAISAARAGAQVVVLERAHSLGRKIMASGGGRCNLTNAKIRAEDFHGSCALAEVSLRFDAQRFFSELGLLCVTEPDGRVFPRCGKSQAVLDVLKTELARLAVEVRLSAEATAVQRQGSGFRIKTAAVPWKKAEAQAHPKTGEDLACDRLILACGGMSYPQLGAGERAYELAKSLGHRLTPLVPALVPLTIRENAFKHLHGLRLDAGLRVLAAGKEVCRARGELLFTEYGLSGPATLDVSRQALMQLRQGQVQVSVDLFPEFSAQGLSEMIAARWKASPERSLKDFFSGMFPSQLSGAVCDSLAWDVHRSLDSLETQACQRLCARLQDWRSEVTGSRGWSEAMVAAGGVSAAEIDAKTFCSRQVPGLYLVGELLDVDGDSGGFNLHFAWASGLAAGAAAART